MIKYVHRLYVQVIFYMYSRSITYTYVHSMDML